MEEVEQQENNNIMDDPRADFMMDVRSNFLSTPIYISVLDSLTGGKALRFINLTLSAICLFLSFGIPLYISNREIVVDQSIMVFPHILFILSMIYVAILILIPQQNSNAFSIGFKHFISLYIKKKFDKKPFKILNIENNLVFFEDKTIGLLYEVDGIFNETMFASDVLEARKQLKILREELENITTISVLEISKTDFAPQKQHLLSIAKNPTSQYQEILSKRMYSYFVDEMKSEQVTKTTILFRTHNRNELKKIGKMMDLMRRRNIKKYKLLSSDEIEKFFEGF